MKIEDYKGRIDTILTNPDTALAEIGGVYEELETDLATLESLASENESLKARIKDLETTNIKLYMSQGGETVEADEETEDEDEKAVEEFFNELLGEE